MQPLWMPHLSCAGLHRVLRHLHVWLHDRSLLHGWALIHSPAGCLQGQAAAAAAHETAALAT